MCLFNLKIIVHFIAIEGVYVQLRNSLNTSLTPYHNILENV